jgi:hypothetical protein
MLILLAKSVGRPVELFRINTSILSIFVISIDAKMIFLSENYFH